MRLLISTLTLAFMLSLVGTSHAQFGSGTSAGFDPSGAAVGGANYQGDMGFAHSISDQQTGFVRSSAIGVSDNGEVSYSRSIAQRQGSQTNGDNLQIINSSQGSHFSGGQIKAVGPPSQFQVQGDSRFGSGGIRGGATSQARGRVVTGRAFAITNRANRPIVPANPIWLP